uniref:Hydrogenase n=1 Tax=Thermosphaera aggregans TaxID=54254 RepID=A0A7C2BKG1_9CREN
MFDTILVGIVSGAMLVLPLLLDGLERKVKAGIQTRIGPPVTQTLYDFLKLMGKEVKPFTGSALATYMALLTILLQVSSLIALNYFIIAERNFQILFAGLALFLVAQASSAMTPLLVPNPFSQIGGYREVVISLVNEFTMILSIGAISLILGGKVASPYAYIGLLSAMITLFITSYVSTGRPPFDIAEAEVELASGIFVEFSGPLLAAYVYGMLTRRLLAKMIPLVIILQFLTDPGLITPLILVPLIVVIWLVYGIAATIVGRTRIDMAPISLLKLYIPLMVLSITGLLIGVYHA